MADPLSIAAGVVGIVGFAGVILAKGYAVLRLLSESTSEVKKLLEQLSQLTGILVAIEAQEKGSKKNTDAEQVGFHSITQILDSSLTDCRKTLKKVWHILDKLEKSGKIVLLAKWQLLEPQVKASIGEIEHYKSSFTLCLGLDVKKQTHEILELSQVISVQLQELRDDKEKEKAAAEVERACSNRRALLRWLVPTSDERHEKALKLRTSGTCDWLMENDTFVSWSQGTDSTLWLNGIPGSGKTILVSQIIEKLKTRSRLSAKAVGVAYFYCTYAESEKSKFSQILCSLAAQLIRCFPQPETGPAMHLFNDCDEGSLAPNAEKTQQLLISLMGDMEAVFICLDALDECNPDEKSDLLQFIFVTIAACANVKILVSSRTGDIEIGEYLDGSPSITITAHAVAKDIDIYVRNRIDKGSKRLKLAMTETFVEKLTSGAQGMFLWVSCQLDQLARLHTTADIQTALKHLPRGLYMTYHRILEHVPPENEICASRALRWVAYAAAPMKLDELVEAIAVNEDSSQSLRSLQKLMIPDDVFQICGSLLRRSDITGTMELAHTSVFEFLTSSDSQSRSLGQFHIPSTKSGTVLAKTCLTYLSFEDFHLGDMGTTMSSDLSETWALELSHNKSFVERPFFDYALRHWWKHLTASQDDVNELWPYLKRLFDPKMGNFRTIITLLNQLEGAYKYPLHMQPIHFCATNGIALLPSLLLDNLFTEVDSNIGDGRTALHMAVENGHKFLVQELLNRGANVNLKTEDGRSPLQLALESADEPITRLLVAGGASVNAMFSTGDTPLTLVVGNNWISLVSFLLSKNADPSGRLFDGRTALHVAAEFGSDIDVITLLSNSGASLTSGDDQSWTPLHYAAHNGHTEHAMILKRDPRTPKLFQKIGWTPLHAAVQQEHLHIIELFAEFARGISESSDSVGRPQPEPSRPSLMSSSFKVAGTADNPAESTAAGESVATPRMASSPVGISSPLSLATSQGYLAGLEILMDAGASEEDVRNCMKIALAQRKLAVLGILVDNIEERLFWLQSLQLEGQEALQDSRSVIDNIFRSFLWNEISILDAMKKMIRRGYPDILQLLIEQFREFQDEARSQTLEQLPKVLQVATEYRDMRAVMLLHKAGADLFATIKARLGRYEKEVVSCTFLHFAVSTGDADLVSYFLKNSLSSNATDSRSRTPLHYAVALDNSERIINLLLSSGADISLANDQGHPPLHVASRYGVLKSISSLLAAGASVDALDHSRMTPLHHCAYCFPYTRKYDNPATLYLLEAGADIEATDKKGHTPPQTALIESLETDAPEFLSSLVDLWPHLLYTKFGLLERTTLHLAAAAGCGSYLLRLLIKTMKVDREAVDKDGKTAVQLAADERTQRALINLGAIWKE